ncbi:MAG: BamA/TamA family outer membrane protein, partial [Thermoanaerobaculia bacterium]|nr:BamA/TamA family outer membrane protein [Thermoanaerobaculia bacterium]
GFKSYSISPREDVLGSGELTPVGGHKYTAMNLEFIYRVNDPLRFVLFADAGQAYGYQEDWDFGELRYSAGAELRIFLPVFQFPLRFIYASNLDPQPNDRFESFQFSVGNTF